MMRRRQFITLLGGAGAAAWPLAARAQQPDQMRRIGVLMGYAESDPETQAWVTAFVQGFKELGWIVGRNVWIDYRFGAGDADRIRAYAEELVGLAPAVILAHSSPVTAALQQAAGKLTAKMAGTNPTGVVVSPDAFFRMEKTAFTTAMTSGLNVPICYPFKDYSLRTTPVTDQLLKGGPVLSIDPNGANPNDVQQMAYYQFGYLAGQFLDSPSPLQPVKTWTWNGTSGQWL